MSVTPVTAEVILETAQAPGETASSEPVEAFMDPIVQTLLPEQVQPGVLVPLKTSMELRDDTVTGEAYVTRSPLKSANAVVGLLRTLLPETSANTVPHLRRCAKPLDLPNHVKSHFMHESGNTKQVHTGKAGWIYILLGPIIYFDRAELVKELSKVEGVGDHPHVAIVPVPLLAPTSQIQAAAWSSQFWPAVYRKNNPLGPHPSLVSRATEEISGDASTWMTLAFQVARKSKAAGYGEGMGATIVQRTPEGPRVVALAADARWLNQEATCARGNPMAHCVLRAISMVAQKLVRTENRETGNTSPPILEFEAFQDDPLLDDEQAVFELDHPSPDGYLCHGLELYLTHEPCTMCSMAILHSRMGRVAFCNRMPLSGGLSAEDRGHPLFTAHGGGRGLGLFWRRELNWSLLAWEWETFDHVKPMPVSHYIHA